MRKFHRVRPPYATSSMPILYMNIYPEIRRGTHQLSMHGDLMPGCLLSQA